MDKIVCYYSRALGIHRTSKKNSTENVNRSSERVEKQEQLNSSLMNILHVDRNLLYRSMTMPVRLLWSIVVFEDLKQKVLINSKLQPMKFQ